MQKFLRWGRGGGHNALGTVNWGIKHIDLVEPNPTGVETIGKLFDEYLVSHDKYSVFHKTLEEYKTDKHYDIVIAEGFLSYLPNAKEICKKLMTFVSDGGVVVITCADDICIFIELIKRLIGQIIVRDAPTLHEKVEMLIPIFEPQLKKLRGVSRPAKDWIEDNIFNPAFSNGCQFSMLDALEAFKEFDLLGSSPRMFTDYSWYKDIWFDEKDDYRKQFLRKRMSLIMAGLPEQMLDEKDVEPLVESFADIKKLENRLESEGEISLISSILQEMSDISELVHKVLNKDFITVFDEITDIISELLKGNVPNFNKYPFFFSAFGRGLQYMSFMKP